MNTKRQTIWLVSMLSLMVVLSAYYLFTEDTTTPDTTSAQSQTVAPGNSSEVLQSGDSIIQEVTSSQSGEGDTTASNEGAINGEDQKILDQIAKDVMAGNQIEEMQTERNNTYQTELERLYGVLNDTTVTDEKLLSAFDEMEQLDEQETKIAHLEEELQKDYSQAVITHENGAYTVVVESPKLEVKQAVAIISKLMKELNVSQDKVTVKYITG